jgi:cullin-associated NEDD8-dissociated protein 1
MLSILAQLITLNSYSDDEDTSYKIRRSATKLLAAIIGTRGDLLPTLLKDVSPVLISRFGDREVSVKSEIWATYTMLLNQIVVYGGARPEQSGLKRKRDNEGGMDEEGSPFALLRTQVPALSKQLFGQLKGSKVPPNILQAGFGLLSALLKVLPGSLSGQTSQLFSLCSGILSQSVSTATASLNISVLQFLALFFEAHSSTVFSGSIGTITPALISSLKQRHPRVAAETFRVFTALISSLRPVKSEDWLSQVYQEALARMKANDTDAEVRQTAEQVIGELWISAPDFVKTQGGAEWDYVLRSSERIESPISVITRVAKEGEISNPWIEKSIGWIIGVLKRSGRSGKADAFAALEVLLQRCVKFITERKPPTVFQVTKDPCQMTSPTRSFHC